jgi:hypothetical protein
VHYYSIAIVYNGNAFVYNGNAIVNNGNAIVYNGNAIVNNGNAIVNNGNAIVHNGLLTKMVFSHKYNCEQLAIDQNGFHEISLLCTIGVQLYTMVEKILLFTFALQLCIAY